MRAWSGEPPADLMGASVAGAGSGRARTPPPLKNGSELRAAGYLIAVGSRTDRFRRKHKNKMLIVVLLVLLLLLMCLAVVMTVLYARQRRGAPPLCETRECLRSAANLALSMDPTADPCDDFYQFACGGWAEQHPRPDALRSYDWFREQQARVYARVRDELAGNGSLTRHPERQARDMFLACMDTETLDKLGLKPALQILESVGLPPYPTYVNATGSDYSAYSFDWLQAVVRVKTQLGMDVLIGFDIFTDPRNSSVYRLVMGSPETTNPFPSIHKEKKRHSQRKSWKHKVPTSSRTVDNTFTFHDEHRFESQERDADDEEHEERAAHVYRLFYAELMKLFLVESGDIRHINLSETELDQNIFLASNEYYTFNDDMYELEADNSTEPEEDLYLNIPEYTVDELQAHTDAVVADNNGDTARAPSWQRYLQGVFAVSGVQLDWRRDRVLASAPDLRYLARMAAYVARAPPALLELYVWVKVVEVLAVHTTSELRALVARAGEQARRGRGEGAGGEGCLPRSLQCAGAVNDMLGMAVASVIADPHFLNVTKPKIQIMIDEMKNALAHLVGKAKWMDDDTKLATYKKIVQMRTLIGFPEWLLEEGRLEEYYEGIEVGRDTHLDNMVSIVQVKVRKALNRFREGNNFTWATDPTEVNAYHTFQENTITVPLVMLQYPFFDLGLDSLNYGSLGTILGHEITHGFDNFGRQFDKDGNLVPWWSNETVAAFLNVTQCFVDQYSAYYVPELDEHVDGKKTLGENIADNGGLREALAALHAHLRLRGPEPRLPGFQHYSPEQLFFLAFGNLWCGVSTRASLAADLSDEHAPQLFRARAALQNSEQFARAWRCQRHARMSPQQRCVIF